MPTQRTKFGLPITRVAKPTFTLREFDLTKGVNFRDPGTIGGSVTIINYEKIGGGIAVRSGMSTYDNTFTQGAGALWGSMVYGVDGMRAGVFASLQTLSWITADAWSHLSYVAGSPSGDTIDSSIIAGIDGTYSYDLSLDNNICVITNNRQDPKFFEITPTNTTFSDFTFASSLFSRAASVEAFDNRLVWFNVASSSSTFPQRVVWSARGEPTNYVVDDGAGLADLMDMRGIGQRVVRSGDEIYLFSDEEIWAGRARGDVYAFDFRRISAEVGCPHPRSIAVTPHGVTFLGSDHEVYILRNDALQILGGDPDDGESRVRKFIRERISLDRNAWGVYNPIMHRYELYLPLLQADFYPSSSLQYVFDNNSWWFNYLGGVPPTGTETPISLSAGFYFAPTDTGLTWDAIGSPWDDFPVSWDEADALHEDNRRIVVSTSNGTPAAFHPNSTTDLGWDNQAIVRLPTLNNPQEPFERMLIRDTFVEYFYDVGDGSTSSSILSVSISDYGGASALDYTPFVLSSSSQGLSHIPLMFEGRYPSVTLWNDFADKTVRLSRVKVLMTPAGSAF